MAESDKYSCKTRGQKLVIAGTKAVLGGAVAMTAYGAITIYFPTWTEGLRVGVAVGCAYLLDFVLLALSLMLKNHLGSK